MQFPEDNPRIWQVPGHDLRIEFRESFLETLRVAARLQFSSGAVRVVIQRGALLGSTYDSPTHDAIIRLDGSAPLGARLSADEQRSIVGWYALRTAKENSLSSEDLNYLNRPSTDPREIALIVRPADNEAIRVGVFFREDSGNIRLTSSFREILVVPPGVEPPKAIPGKQTEAAPRVQAPVAIAETRPSRGWALFALVSIVGTILSMITFIELHAPGSPLQTPPLHGAPANRVNAVDPARTNEQLASDAQRLKAELEAQRNHNRRLEIFLEELRERNAGRVIDNPPEKVKGNKISTVARR
jgi:hypothetical protein